MDVCRDQYRINTAEPPILELANAKLLEGDKPWNKERLPLVEERVRNRLKQISARLGNADWLDGAFSAGDLTMMSVRQAETGTCSSISMQVITSKLPGSRVARSSALTHS